MAKNETTTTNTDAPEAWIAENPGDSLRGVVTDVDTAWSDYRGRANPSDPNAGFYPLLTVKDDNGKEWTLHGFRTVLYNELTKRQPIPGETIVVTYHGTGEAKNGMNAPEIYRVTVEGRSPEAAKDIYKNLSGGHQSQPSPAQTEPDVPADTEGLPF